MKPHAVSSSQSTGELPRQTGLRDSVGVEPPPIQAPRPEEYGLTPQVIQLFGASKLREDAWSTVVAAGAGLGFILSLAAPFWAGKSGDLAFWLCCLVLGPALGMALVVAAPFSIIGLALEHVIRRARDQRARKAERTDPSYPNYLRYKEACRMYEESLAAASRAATQMELARLQELWVSVAWWKGLDGKRFERELTEPFKRMGFEVRWTGRHGADEGIDITLKANGKRILVQCKAHKEYIGPGRVRDLYGTLMHQKADEAWLITTSGFYSGASSFARGKPIRLLTIEDVLEGQVTAGAHESRRQG